MSFESIRWKKYLETNNNYEKYDKTVIFYNKEFINLYKEDISAYEKNDKYLFHRENRGKFPFFSYK